MAGRRGYRRNRKGQFASTGGTVTMGRSGGFHNLQHQQNAQAVRANRARRARRNHMLARNAKVVGASALGGVLAAKGVSRVTGSSTLGVAALVAGGVASGQAVARNLR
jgi:hypothetical protein